MDDAEQSADPAQAHPFEMESHCLVVDGDAMTLLLRSGSKAPLAGNATIPSGSGTIVAPFPDPSGAPAVRAEWNIHTAEYRLSPPL